MSKPQLIVTCLFAEEGELVQDILLRSFMLFLGRELEYNGRTLVLSK